MDAPANLENLTLEELSYYVWGSGWKTHLHYLAMMESIEKGRSQSSAANDLRERLRHWDMYGTPPGRGPVPPPYQTECW